METTLMEFHRHVPRALHQDHAATLAILERLETLLGRYGVGRPPDARAADTATFLKDLVTAVEVEIGPHFAFEEQAVFPVLAESGGEMGELLSEEHREILPLAQRLAKLARVAPDTGLTPETWSEFHELGARLIERLVAHVQKEDMGLLPALDEMLDDETDGRLAIEFAGRR